MDVNQRNPARDLKTSLMLRSINLSLEKEILTIL